MAHTTKELMEVAWEMARKLGIEHVEEKAQEILDKHPEFIEFITEDDNAFFTKSCPEVIGRIGEIPLDEIPDAKELGKFLVDWEERLEITGKNIRVMQTGAIRTEGDTYAHMPTPRLESDMKFICSKCRTPLAPHETCPMCGGTTLCKA